MSAALVGALALWFLIGPAPGLARLAPPRARRQRRLPPWLILLSVSGVGAAGAIGARAVGWLAVLSIAVGTAGWILLAERRRRAASERAGQCALAARALSSLLKSGQIPSAALAEAARDAPVLAPAAAAARLGADIGAELERASSVPGQAGMAAVAAAWRISERSGAPVAEVLAEVAENLRRQRQLQAVIDAELAAARTSGNIMAALPLFAVGLGFVAGTNPVEFLLGGVLGQVLVLLAVTLTAGGVLWIDRLAQGKKVLR